MASVGRMVTKAIWVPVSDFAAKVASGYVGVTRGAELVMIPNAICRSFVAPQGGAGRGALREIRRTGTDLVARGSGSRSQSRCPAQNRQGRVVAVNDSQTEPKPTMHLTKNNTGGACNWVRWLAASSRLVATTGAYPQNPKTPIFYLIRFNQGVSLFFFH